MFFVFVKGILGLQFGDWMSHGDWKIPNVSWSAKAFSIHVISHNNLINKLITINVLSHTAVQLN